METSTAVGVAVAFAAVALAICGVILRKIVRIDLATRALAVNSGAIRAETETLFRQVQALLALERRLDLREPLPLMRGWAGSPDFLLFIADEIRRRQPNTLLECGSGVSTLVCARMVQKNGCGRVISLEHDTVYADATRRLLTEYGLSNWATVVLAPLDTKGSNSPWYSVDALSKSIAGIDMLIVDGPPSTVAPLARYPTLPVLASRLAPHAVIIVDDANRHDEREMLQLWAYEFPEFSQRDADCEKGCVILQKTSSDSASVAHG